MSKNKKEKDPLKRTTIILYLYDNHTVEYKYTLIIYRIRFLMNL